VIYRIKLYIIQQYAIILKI